MRAPGDASVYIRRDRSVTEPADPALRTSALPQATTADGAPRQRTIPESLTASAVAVNVRDSPRGGESGDRGAGRGDVPREHDGQQADLAVAIARAA